MNVKTPREQKKRKLQGIKYQANNQKNFQQGKLQGIKEQGKLQENEQQQEPSRDRTRRKTSRDQTPRKQRGKPLEKEEQVRMSC